MNHVGVYYESWAAGWTSSSTQLVETLPIGVNHVYLSFVQPDCRYTKFQGHFGGTGLQFSMDYKVVEDTIANWRQKGIKVFLSVGGATYTNWKDCIPKQIADLCWDLHCDGIDLDYEPHYGDQIDHFHSLINEFRQYMGTTKSLIFTGFAYGALPKGEGYKGINLETMKQFGHQFDHVNIMTYDGGKDLDVKLCYESWKVLHSKVNIGVQVGAHGWGDGKLELHHLDEYETFKDKKDGYFIWANFKPGVPSTKQVVEKMVQLFTSNDEKEISYQMKIDFNFKETNGTISNIVASMLRK